MRGSVGYDRKRKTWWWKFSYPDADGARHYPKKRGFPTKAAAQASLNEALYTHGQVEAPPALTVLSYLELSLARRLRSIEPTTAASYARHLKNRVDGTPLARLFLKDLSAKHLQAWVDAIDAKPVSIHSYWNAVHALLRPLVDDGHLKPRDVRVRLPLVPRERMRVWTREETLQVLETLKDDPIGPVVTFLVTTGMRPGEALALTWDDLDAYGGVTVSKSVYFEGVTAFVKGTKTGKIRRVALLPETLEVLRIHKARQDERAALEPHWKTLNLIFPRPMGGHWRPQMLSKQFQRRLKKHNLPPLHLYGMRHTHGSQLLDSMAVPIPEIAARLGHTPGMLLNVYSHQIGEGNRAALEASRYLFGATGGHNNPPTAPPSSDAP